MEAVITIQTKTAIVPITGLGTIMIQDHGSEHGKLKFCGQGFAVDLFDGKYVDCEYHLNQIGAAIEKGNKFYLL
jgi:hypothetical protein